MTLTELSKELGVPWSTLKLRLKVLKLEKLDLVSEGILRSHFRKGLGEPGSYNNGEIEIKVKEGFLPPEGFVKGSLQKGG